MLLKKHKYVYWRQLGIKLRLDLNEAHYNDSVVFYVWLWLKADSSSFFCLFNGDRDSQCTKWVRHIAILVHLGVLQSAPQLVDRNTAASIQI